MTNPQIAGVALGKNGFLANYQEWTEQLAAELAAADGLALTDCHWSVIRFVRDYYESHSVPPSGRVIVKSIGKAISEHVPCTRRHLDALFPQGGCRQACRIAGLPEYYLVGC